MRILFVFMMLLPPAALAGGEPQGEVKEVGEAGRCEMSLNIGWYARQDVSIKPGRIVGPDFNLHIEDDVIYGFIRGKTTRFRVKKDSVSGTAAGFDLMLHVNKSDFETEVRGLVGVQRVVATVSDEKVSVSSVASSLAVSKEKAGYFRGHVGRGGSEIQFADMTLSGCDLSVLRERPGLIVALFMAWLGA
jgi:hypothetical protein